MAIFSEKFSSDGYATRCRRMMSCSEQATKKYCCRSRNSFPNIFKSLGYSTFEIVSERFLSSTAFS